MMPDQRSIASIEVTPSCGSISGMIGLRKVIEPVMTNWMPTMAQSVRCQLRCGSGGALGGSAVEVVSVIRRTVSCLCGVGRC